MSKPIKSRFVHGNKSWKTRSLFVDACRSATNREVYSVQTELEAPYWLSDKDEGDTRPVLRELFLGCADPTGIKMARKYLGGYDHLRKLLKCAWFKKEWVLWLDELEAQLASEALDVIKVTAKGETTQAFLAAKFLATKEYKDKKSSTRGRPSAAEVAGNLKQEAQVQKETLDDYARITGFKVIDGGRAT